MQKHMQEMWQTNAMPQRQQQEQRQSLEKHMQLRKLAQEIDIESKILASFEES